MVSVTSAFVGSSPVVTRCRCMNDRDVRVNSLSQVAARIARLLSGL
jgi:hypothetical protein